MHAESNPPPPTDDRSRRAESDLSMDDLEAAQALEGLRSGMLPSQYEARLGSVDGSPVRPFRSL